MTFPRTVVLYPPAILIGIIMALFGVMCFQIGVKYATWQTPVIVQRDIPTVYYMVYDEGKVHIDSTCSTLRRCSPKTRHICKVCYNKFIDTKTKSMKAEGSAIVPVR